MTPKMIEQFSRAIRICLDHECYATEASPYSAPFMCLALGYAFNQNLLSHDETVEIQEFLHRWVRFMACRLKIKTPCISMLDIRLNNLNDLNGREWCEQGHGIRFYRGLLVRLEQKAQARSAQ